MAHPPPLWCISWRNRGGLRQRGPGQREDHAAGRFRRFGPGRAPRLLVAGARCAPGGSEDPLAPLRRLAEMLFGDLHRGVAWHPGGEEEVERLGIATGLALACLEEQGSDLAGTLIPVASIARRGGSSPAGSRGGLAHGALSQGILFDQLLCTLAAIVAERPLLLLLDDLHWVDAATAAFLLHLGRNSARRSAARQGAARQGAACARRISPGAPGDGTARPCERRGGPPSPGVGHRRAAPAEGRDRGGAGSGGWPRLRGGVRRRRAEPAGGSLSGRSLCTDGRACALHRRDAAQPAGPRGARQGRGRPLGRP